MIWTIMVRASIVAAVLLASGSFLSAKDHPDAQPLLDSALQQAQLFERVASPFSLEVDFTAQFAHPMQGHLTLRWESKDHWWTNVTMNGFDLTQIRNGEWEYTLRNYPYTPMQVQDLFGLLHIGTELAEVAPRKVSNRKKHDTQMTCLEVQPKKSNGSSGEFCVDPTSHELLSENWLVPLNEHRETVYSDHFDFNGQRYPRELDLSVNGAKAISAKVTDLRLAAFDQALLSQPAGAIVRRRCPGMKPPIPLPPAAQAIRSIGSQAGPDSGISP